MLCLKSSIGLCRKVNWYSMTVAAHAELDQTDCTEGTLNNILFIGKRRYLCGWGWFIRELLGDCSHHRAPRISFFFLSFWHWLNTVFVTVTVFYTLEICMSFLYNSSDWGIEPSALRSGRIHETWPDRAHLPCHVANLLHLGAPLQYALILVNERGSGGGSHCRDHWSSLSENLYSI